MEKHVRDQLVQTVLGLYLKKWNAIEIKEFLMQKGLSQQLADEIDEAGWRDYRRMKRTANAHIASGSFLFVVGLLITWGVYSATSGTIIVVCLGIIFLGIAEFIMGLRMRNEL